MGALEEAVEEVEALALADELRAAIDTHGENDSRTKELRVRCESSLQAWQQKAEQAVERDEFEEVERLSKVTHKLGDSLNYKGRPPPSPGHAGGTSHDVFG